jgi:hypothetical protein
MSPDEVFAKWVGTDGQFTEDPPQLATDIIMIYTVAGIIGNGGFQYLFENDFLGTTHLQIAEAYRRIGFNRHAEFIEQLVSLFPGGRLHQDLSERSNFLEERFDWGKDGSRNIDIKEADEYFWNNNEKVYARIAALCLDL